MSLNDPNNYSLMQTPHDVGYESASAAHTKISDDAAGMQVGAKAKFGIYRPEVVPMKDINNPLNSAQAKRKYRMEYEYKVVDSTKHGGNHNGRFRSYAGGMAGYLGGGDNTKRKLKNNNYFSPQNRHTLAGKVAMKNNRTTTNQNLSGYTPSMANEDFTYNHGFSQRLNTNDGLPRISDNRVSRDGIYHLPNSHSVSKA